MKHRGRVLTSLAHRVPDRVPRILNLIGAACDQFKDKTGATDAGKYRDMEFASVGTVGVQSALRFGAPREVKDVLRRQIEILGDGGGFVLAPTNAVEPDVSWENILAFFEAADEYGWYTPRPQ